MKLSKITCTHPFLINIVGINTVFKLIFNKPQYC